MRLSSVLKDVQLTGSTADMQMEVQALCEHSGCVRPGSAFVCMPGLCVDGRDFIAQARQRGAAVVCSSGSPVEDVPWVGLAHPRRALAQMACNWYGHPSKKLALIGITGTNGKTTVSHMVREILRQDGKMVGLIGTNHNLIGDEELQAQRTTPAPLELQALLAQMVEHGVQYAVMEVSSHALALERVYGCAFAAGVFTNLTQDHLDFHGSMEAYRSAKSKLFSMCQVGVLRAEDAATPLMLQEARCPCVQYGCGASCAYRAKDICLRQDGSTLELCWRGGELPLRVPIPGRFSVQNALAAAAVCLELDISPQAVRLGLERMQGVQGRLERVHAPVPFAILIDYAHTPDGLKNVLETVREFTPGRVILLFGCGGDRDKGKRPKMGRIAAEGADVVLLTSDNPRTEDPQAILKEIGRGMEGCRCPYVCIEDREQAIAYGMELAQPGDTLLLCGKGHETYQERKEGRIPFDERSIIQKILERRTVTGG